jgi:hypothetical protein
VKLFAVCGRGIDSLQRRAHLFFPRPLRERVRVRGVRCKGAPLHSIAIGHCLGKEKKSYGVMLSVAKHLAFPALRRRDPSALPQDDIVGQMRS